MIMMPFDIKLLASYRDPRLISTPNMDIQFRHGAHQIPVVILLMGRSQVTSQVPGSHRRRLGDGSTEAREVHE